MVFFDTFNRCEGHGDPHLSKFISEGVRITSRWRRWRLGTDFISGKTKSIFRVFLIELEVKMPKNECLARCSDFCSIGFPGEKRPELYARDTRDILSAGKHLHVTCAIIERDDLILAAQRSASMSLPLKWEFPGGKIDPGESAEDCLRREVLEEMGVSLAIGQCLPASTHHYPKFTVTLYPFVCQVASGDITLHEHSAIAWLSSHELDTLDWAEADLPVIASYLAEKRDRATDR